MRLSTDRSCHNSATARNWFFFASLGSDLTDKDMYMCAYEYLATSVSTTFTKWVTDLLDNGKAWKPMTSLKGVHKMKEVLHNFNLTTRIFRHHDGMSYVGRTDGWKERLDELLDDSRGETPYTFLMGKGFWDLQILPSLIMKLTTFEFCYNVCNSAATRHRPTPTTATTLGANNCHLFSRKLLGDIIEYSGQ